MLHQRVSPPTGSPLPAPAPAPRPHLLLVPSCRCGLLNCEAVLELLTRRLDGTSECVQMVRAGPRLGAPGGMGVGR